MKKIIYIFIALNAIFITSCKQALDVEPISTLTPGAYWKTQDDVNGGLLGMYVQLRSVATSDLYFLGEGRSDILTNATAGTTGLDKYYNNTLNVSNPGPTWTNQYAAINAANLLIKYVPTITFTSAAAKNSALAQAYTMRAFMYFTLTRTWGGVPIRTEPLEAYNPVSVQVPRSTVEQVFQLIKNDLSTALSLYPDNAYAAGRNTWNKPAANALKGEVYLWTGKLLNGGQADFTTALNAISEAQNSDVQLLPNYSDIFSYTNKGNKEVMMAVRFQLLDINPATSNNNYYFNMFVRTLSNVSAATAAAVGTLGANPAENIMQITTPIRNQFTTDDQRRAGTFYEIYNNSNTFVTAITTKGAGTVSNGVRNFVTDVILYRYADLLLMKAEAENALGMDPTTSINMVRQRAYGVNYPAHVFVSGSKDQNDAAILKERLFELTTEGKRWWDLLRFNQAFNLVPSLQGKQASSYLLLFPIGVNIRTLEPSVTENPGWQ